MLLQKPFDDIDDGNVVDVVAVARSMMMILYLVVLKFLLFLIEPKQEETSNVTV